MLGNVSAADGIRSAGVASEVVRRWRNSDGEEFHNSQMPRRGEGPRVGTEVGAWTLVVDHRSAAHGHRRRRHDSVGLQMAIHAKGCYQSPAGPIRPYRPN